MVKLLHFTITLFFYSIVWAPLAYDRVVQPQAHDGLLKIVQLLTLQAIQCSKDI